MTAEEKRSRAGNLRSSIYQDDKGVWHGWVTMGIRDNGSPDRRHRRGKTQNEVAAKVTLLEAARAASRVPPTGKQPTLGTWLTYCVDTIWPEGLGETTLADYRGLVELHLIPGLGEHRLDKLKPEHLETLYAKLRRSGLAPSTVLKVHRVLSSALTLAFKREKITRNVAQMVTVRRPDPVERPSLDVDEARKVLGEALKDARMAARWAFALEVGVRQGEALGLQWRDLDLDLDAGTGVATIRRQLRRIPARHACGEPVGSEPVRHHGKVIQRKLYPCGQVQPIRCPSGEGGGLKIIDWPKSKRPRRATLSPALILALEYHREFQSKERELAGNHWSDDPKFGDLVFRQANGRPFEPRADYGAWVDLLATAGVTPGGTHSARHTAATLLLEAGVQARVVADILGHSTTRLLDTYAHVIPTMTDAASKRMEGVLWK